ncbi:MAG: 7-cyano-7-deazaguanine synthase QueC [Pseudomonadota bacterium]
MKSAVVLLSGGMDSATTIAIAKEMGFRVFALSVEYGQRHLSELEAAKQVAAYFEVAEHRLVSLNMNQWGGSALTATDIDVPLQPSEGIPVTYVPARNTIMLSLALSWAEVLGAFDIFIGVNAVDYSGYPDCRPEYIEAFERLANLATKAGVEAQTESERFKIHSPLQYLTKADIIRKGHALNVNFSLTVSCYKADSLGRACGVCDACRLRKKGFEDAGLLDQTHYILSGG